MPRADDRFVQGPDGEPEEFVARRKIWLLLGVALFAARHVGVAAMFT
jgi:hypothetical protein